MNEPRFSQFDAITEASPELLTEGVGYPRYASPTISSQVFESIRMDEDRELAYDPRVECRLFNDQEKLRLLACRECQVKQPSGSLSPEYTRSQQLAMSLSNNFL